MKRYIVLVVLACLANAGCSRDQGVSGTDAGPGPGVVAQVGDEKITEQDIEEIVSRIPPQYRVRYTTSQGRREIVDGLIDMKMLAWEARRRGVDKQEEVRTRIGYLIDQVLAKELEGELKKSVKVGDGDIETCYREHLDRYVTPERIRARHILVEEERLAGELLERIRKGADFAGLAKEHSSCPSASKGGDLGWLGRGKMDPKFEKAAFSLAKGELSGVVKSPSGYHLIRLDDRRESTTKSLEQVRKSIERTLLKERLEAELSAVRQEIRKQAGVVVDDGYFGRFTGAALPGAGNTPAPAAPEGE